MLSGLRPRAIKALLLFAALCLDRASSQDTVPDVHAFELVSVEAANRGKAPLASLKENAAQEGFFNKIFGTDCWTQALKIVENSCRKLSSEQQARFAVALFNCHMRMSGKRTTTCTEDMSIKDCTGQMDDSGFIVYSNFVQHVESMCLFILNQDFDRHTEHLINTLHGATQAAKDNLAAVASELSEQGASLREVGSALEGVATTQHLLAEGVAAASEGVQRLEVAGEAMSGVLDKSLGQGEALLKKHEEVKDSLSTFREHQAAAAAEAMRQWEAASGRASALEEQQLKALEVQENILEEAAKMASETSFMRDALDLVLDYERRSDKLMLMLLGRSYTLEDVMFYVAGLVAVLAATALPSTRAARIPGLLLLSLTMLAERIAVTSDSPFLQVDREGVAMLYLPTISSVLQAAMTGNSSLLLPFADSEEQLHVVGMDYKWLVRKVWIFSGVVMLLHRMVAYRDYERENHKILMRLEKKMKDSERGLIDAMRAMEDRFAQEQAELRRQATMLAAGDEGYLYLDSTQQQQQAGGGGDGRYLGPERAQSGPVATSQPGTVRLRSRLGQVRTSSAPMPASDPAEDELEQAMDAPDRPVPPQAPQRRGSGIPHPSAPGSAAGPLQATGIQAQQQQQQPASGVAHGTPSGSKGHKRHQEEAATPGQLLIAAGSAAAEAEGSGKQPPPKKARQGATEQTIPAAATRGSTADAGKKRPAAAAAVAAAKQPESGAGNSRQQKSRKVNA